MKSKPITNHTELLLRIEELKVITSGLEENLKQSFLVFSKTLEPATAIKNTIRSLAADKEVRIDLTKVGLNIGANFLIDQTLGKYRSVNGFFRSVIVEKISAGLINNNILKFFKPFRSSK